MLDIAKNKEMFLEEMAKVTREGVDGLLDWLKKSDFFEAPASTKYHLSEKGGLCQHSLNVLNRLREELFAEYGDECPYTEETVVIVACLHDLCKVNFYKESTRNVKNEAGKWEEVPYYAVEEKFSFGHGEKSVFLTERYFSLTPQEALAIRFHMGAYGSEFKGGDYSHSAAFEKFPLALLLHLADMKATYLDEKK